MVRRRLPLRPGQGSGGDAYDLSGTGGLPKTGKFTGNTSLDSEVARLFVSYCLGVMKVLHAWAAIEQGKTGNSLGISDPPAFPQTKFPKQLSFGLV